MHSKYQIAKPHNGRLADCPRSPNCVCTQTQSDAHLARPLSFSGSLNETVQRLKQACQAVARLQLMTEEDDYLHFEARSRFFRFVDDVEFYLDAKTSLIHYRSASRLGYSDFGANRARMEIIRKAFEQLTASLGAQR